MHNGHRIILRKANAVRGWQKFEKSLGEKKKRHICLQCTNLKCSIKRSNYKYKARQKNLTVFDITWPKNRQVFLPHLVYVPFRLSQQYKSRCKPFLQVPVSAFLVNICMQVFQFSITFNTFQKTLEDEHTFPI
jgi:hypothetical protein